MGWISSRPEPPGFCIGIIRQTAWTMTGVGTEKRETWRGGNLGNRRQKGRTAGVVNLVNFTRGGARIIITTMAFASCGILRRSFRPGCFRPADRRTVSLYNKPRSKLVSNGGPRGDGCVSPAAPLSAPLRYFTGGGRFASRWPAPGTARRPGRRPPESRACRRRSRAGR